MTKQCTVCYRVMALEQFREFHSGEKAGKRQARCRQCEAGDRAERKSPYLPPPPPDPLSRALCAWRGPVNPAPLRWTA